MPLLRLSSGLLFALLLSSQSLCAGEVLVLDDASQRLLLGFYLETLEDPQKQWTIEDVSSAAFAERFVPSQRETPHLGVVPSVWVRLAVRNDASETREWMIELIGVLLSYDRLDLFVSAPLGSARPWIQKSIEETTPFAQRELKHRFPAFPVSIKPGSTYTLYMRLETSKETVIPLLLWSREAFAKHVHNEQMGMGLSYGFILVMALYNLFLFFSLRDVAYFYYTVYIVVVGVMMSIFDGHAAEYLWPESTWGFWEPFTFLTNLNLICVGIFAQRFLNTRVHAPRMHKFIYFLGGIAFLMLVSQSLGYTPYFPAFTLVWQIVIPWTGVLSWRRGYRPARYFLIALILPLSSVILTILYHLGLFPLNFFFLYGMRISFTCEAVLFSLGLADRINLLRQEKEIQEKETREAELRAQTAELQARAIEAENRRKSEEFEQARQLQSSMLPAEPPQIPHLDIDFFMKTATEVGGDYYDFHIHADGTLTVVLGDATGHGIQAGIVVTAAKSLFMTLAHLPDITETFSIMAAHLKDMKLKRSNMALTMIKFKDRKIRIAAAGMPPALLYRAASKDIEEIFLVGMPLGSSAKFRYRQQLEFDLQSGDTIALMSDGLPERLNGAGEELLGYPRTQELFAAVAQESPKAICQYLAQGGDKWAEGRTQEDDVTFVVLKVT